ncbi:MAG: hypothetical protein HQL08_12235 [Nitrospirae bacterium]|nr:hypothetical protein [Nitrospirota bacterium]
MTRFFKITILAMLCVVLVAGTAMAGSIKVSGAASNAIPYSAALEAMGAARTFTMTAGTAGDMGTAAVAIVPAQTLIANDVLTVTFSNMGFNGTAVSVCSANGANTTNTAWFLVAGPVTTTVNATNQTFRLTGNAVNGTPIFLTDNGVCNVTGGSGTDGSLGVRVLATSSAQLASVSFTDISVGGIVIDSNSKAANAVNIAMQYVTNYAAGVSTIDFTTNAASNGAHFVASGVSTNAAIGGNAGINMLTMTIGAGLSGAPNAGLTVGAVLSLQDSASWQGVKDIYLVSGGTCSLSANNAVNNAPSGTVNLTAPFNGTAAFAASGMSVCSDVIGSAVLQARTIKGSWNISVGTGGVSHAQDSYAAVMTWVPNGYTGIVTYINGSSTYNTICFISNQSTTAAPATFSVLTTESGAAITGLQGIQLGSVPAQGTMRVDINSSITPYSYSSSAETAGTATALTGLQGNDRFTGQFAVGAAPTSVTVNCIQADPAGSKRAVPVVVPNGTATTPYVY